MLTSRTVSEFIDDVSSNSPAPGGGSVSALCGALGTALTAMVCRLTIGKKNYEGVQDEMLMSLGRADDLRAKLTSLIDQDTEAFNLVMKAFTLPKATEDQKRSRSEAIQAATKQATIIPLEVMKLCERGIEIAATVADEGNVNSVTDAGAAGLILRAGCEGAALNVQINLTTLQDKAFVEETSALVSVVLTNVEAISNRIRQRLETVLS
jgi:formiminotetrahydrofolate cyclodeaminase